MIPRLIRRFVCAAIVLAALTLVVSELPGVGAEVNARLHDLADGLRGRLATMTAGTLVAGVVPRRVGVQEIVQMVFAGSVVLLLLVLLAERLERRARRRLLRRIRRLREARRAESRAVVGRRSLRPDSF